MSMATRSSLRRRTLCFLGGAMFFLLGVDCLRGETRLFSFMTSKGLAVQILQDNDLPFIHAELRIHLDGREQNYTSLAVTQLAIMNMFERSLNSPPSNLMEMLWKQGNDFQVEFDPECVKIGMNFLPDRLTSFSKLLREIFTYQSFHLKSFNESKERFWPLVMKNRDWKREIAVLLAYQQLIGNFYFSRSFLLQETLDGINLAQLRSFLLKTFRPDNAHLLLKGRINPYFTLGMIEKDLPPFQPRPARTRKKESPLAIGRKIFILNVDSPEPPMIYWFDVAPPCGDGAYPPHELGNFALFGFPTGRIYQSERSKLMMKGYKVNIETLFMKEFTLLCNSLRLNYGDVENFLLLVDKERRQFAARPIERKEYLDALRFLSGRARLESDRFDHNLLCEIGRFQGSGTPSAATHSAPELFQDVSLNHVLQTMDQQMGNRHKTGGGERGIVILIGNADLIVNNLKSLRTEALRLALD